MWAGVAYSLQLLGYGQEGLDIKYHKGQGFFPFPKSSIDSGAHTDWYSVGARVLC